MAEVDTTIDLFGGEADLFATAKDRLGVWPTTIWEVDYSDSLNKQFKKLLGDTGDARAECFTKKTDDKSVYRGKVTASVFNPSVASWLLNAYAPKEGVCLDPFAGGGTRAILAAKHGLKYKGMEIRRAEVEAVEQRCVAAGVADMVRIDCADARAMTSFVGKGVGDFLITCPPYWNLEVYGGGEKDLSGIKSYSEFLVALRDVIDECFAALKPGARACWVVGLIRDVDGALLPMNHDVARLHIDAGFALKEEIILVQKNNGAMQRVGQFERGHKHLVRLHEYALVFTKP